MSEDHRRRNSLQVARARIADQAAAWHAALAGRAALGLQSVLVATRAGRVVAVAPQEAVALVRARGEDRLADALRADAPPRHVWFVTIGVRTIHVDAVELVDPPPVAADPFAPRRQQRPTSARRSRRPASSSQ